MGKSLPQIYLVRHGETEWSITGQHTGRTDIPLTENGEKSVVHLNKRLTTLKFDSVITSPLIRAKKTCQLAGFGSIAKEDPDLMEWDYGDCEGKTTPDMQKEKPGWYLFKDGCPNGETIDEVGQRATRIVEKLKQIEGNILIFSHGHFLRFIAVSWLQLKPYDARFFQLNPLSLSILGYGHNLEQPVMKLWNDISHLSKQIQ